MHEGLLGRTDIRHELQRERERRLQDELLIDVHAHLHTLRRQETDIKRRLQAEVARDTGPFEDAPSAIFDEAEIERVCTRFRLRFLDSKHFKGAIPLEALHKIRRLEEERGERFKQFKIMAPAPMFKLCDVNRDPLLFTPNGDGQWLLVHRWGNDLSWWRQVRYWPMRNAATLVTTLLCVALIISMLFPNYLLSQDPQATYFSSHRILFFFWTTMVLASFTVFSWFAFFGKFSKQAWDDGCFN